MRGAGGTEGGLGRFFLGLIMLIAGGYLFLNSVQVRNNFHLGMRMYSAGGISITSGYILIPFMIGLGMVFYSSKNYLGWLLLLGALVMLIFGVITNIQMSMRRMTLFELITILVLGVGGLGLFLSSLRKLSRGD